MPLRILMLHNRYLVGGGEDVSTQSQVDLLRAAGHDVVLLEESNERVAELGRLRTAGRTIWSRESHRRVDQALEGERFDIVHVQNFFPLLSPSIYYAAQRHRVPVIQSLRNARLLCPEGSMHRDEAVCTLCVGKSFAWPSIRHSCYRDSAMGSATIAIMTTGHRLAGTWQRRVHRYVAPSQYLRQMFIAGGWDADQIDVIPNYVYPDPGPGAGKGGYALFVGRLDPIKGLDTLLEAWNRDAIELPLRIVGSGPLQDKIEAAASHNPLIEYMGPVDNDTATDLMGEASLVLVPTTARESFGRVAVEAMAKGTPPVVADHGGLSEIVVGGETGLRFAPGDVDALCGKISRLQTHPEQLSQMRTAARERYLDLYTGERALEMWIRLYREAMRTQRSATAGD